MSMIGAISRTPPTVPALSTQVQPKRDNNADEATELNAAKATEAAPPNKLDLTV